MVQSLPRPSSDAYDTIVAGAGPAGVMAAREAAARGRVLLAESSRLPRNKSCGGMLHAYTQEFLEPFGPLPEDIVLEPRHVRFRYHDWDRGIKKPTSVRFLNVDRPGFDRWLLDALPDDVELVEGCPLDAFAEDERGVRAILRVDGEPFGLTCENLIGADGARSVVRRGLGIGSVATYVTLQDWVRLDGEIEPFFDCIYMRGVGDSFAYGYIVPKGNRAIVGSVFYPKSRRPHEKQDQVMSLLRDALPQLGERLAREAWVALSVRSTCDVVPGAGRVLLAGEAAGFMSPTSGEGISYALKSGALAGRAVARSSPDDALAAFAEASRPLQRDIRRKLRWLPVMESEVGKYLGGITPSAIVSAMTKGL
ncbi:MAG TPA: FAD-dependent monooxygenase [Coriobacteriia bacterium]